MKRYMIGRDDSNDIVVPHASVSRRHAELTDLGGGNYKLVDGGSSNGTWCMGETGWESVISQDLDCDAMVRFGDHYTSVAELLMSAGIKPERPGGDPQFSEAVTTPSRTRSRNR